MVHSFPTNAFLANLQLQLLAMMGFFINSHFFPYKMGGIQPKFFLGVYMYIYIYPLYKDSLYFSGWDEFIPIRSHPPSHCRANEALRPRRNHHDGILQSLH